MHVGKHQATPDKADEGSDHLGGGCWWSFIDKGEAEPERKAHGSFQGYIFRGINTEA